jgi:hypothetical protein
VRQVGPSIVAAALAIGAPSVARAFSDPAMFASPALEGGGEGRYFTGSVADGHSCGVCHGGAPAPDVHVEGLPDQVEPGRAYGVTLSWAAARGSHALALELLDDEGRQPMVTLPPDEAIPPESRCEEDPDGAAAIYAVDVGERRIVGVEDCGASTLRLAFVAPTSGAVRFSMGVVLSNGAGDVGGDGVFEARTILLPRGADAVPVGGACAAAPGPPSGAWGAALGGLAACVWLARRRRGRPAAVAAFAAAALSGCYGAEIPADYVPSDGADRTPTDRFQTSEGGSDGGGGGEGGAGGGAPVPCEGSPPPSVSALRFSVLTSPAGGKFAPRNVGAIWIQDASGGFVRTLERWGKKRAKWLQRFNAVSGGNVVDAVTGATLQTHETHEVTWDLTDLGGCEVPHGSYTVSLELTDRSGPGVTLDVPFEKSPEGTTVQPEDAPSFHEILLTVE